jgi:hypothetical protein
VFWALLLTVAVSSAPLIAVTFVARRMGYKAVWLIGPWGVFVALWLLVGIAVYGISQVTPSEEAGMDATMSTAIGVLVAGYLTALVNLMVLAVRRLPTRPADTAAVF